MGLQVWDIILGSSQLFVVIAVLLDSTSSVFITMIVCMKMMMLRRL